jgi:23S rRNA (adenine2503-C2)-methyltransferase
VSRYDLSRESLEEILADEPRFRLDQVWLGIHEQLSEPRELTVLPKPLRDRLEADDRLGLAFDLEEEAESPRGGTLKWLLRSREDGAIVETVVMKYRERATVCVSSQVGCAMRCSFCATGQLGFGRQLRSGEIVEQVVRAARACRDRSWGRLKNVVLMGMGEPFSNYDNVLSAIRRCNGDIGMAARSFTVSTVGIVPGIRRLAGEELQVNLAVSLHAANDELRSSLVPVNRRYPLAAVLGACGEYVAATRRRISFEWALISGVNDRRRDAGELAALLAPLGQLAHVNLIPLNPTPGYLVAGSPPAAVAAFRHELASLGVNVTVRDTRGRDVGGACGQLAGASHGRGVAVRGLGTQGRQVATAGRLA